MKYYKVPESTFRAMSKTMAQWSAISWANDNKKNKLLLQEFLDEYECKNFDEYVDKYILPNFYASDYN